MSANPQYPWCEGKKVLSYLDRKTVSKERKEPGEADGGQVNTELCQMDVEFRKVPFYKIE